MTQLSNKEVKTIIGTKFPKTIICESDGDRIRLRLREQAVGCAIRDNANMQEDEAAFEPWALLLRKAGKEVVLDVQDGVSLKDVQSLRLGHYGRFLYRALRFSEGFGDWFSLSEPIAEKVADMAELLKNEKTINNTPSSQETEPSQAEARLEKDFAASGVSFLPGITLHRQLPVGLFKDEVLSGNNVFTGGNSAIDLWGIDGDTFHAIELKAGKNKKMGAISEMFFYANYVYDVFCGGGFGGEMFTLNQQLADDATARGYGKILNSSPTKVLAHVLIEEGMCHSALESTLLELRSYKHENIGFDSEVHTYSTQI